jgi:hypothetical protein
MNKEFVKEHIFWIFIEVIVIGIVIFLVQGYFNNRWQPLTAAETLRKENYLNAKRDTYFEAINILNRTLANTNFITQGKVSDTTNRNIGGTYPTDIEINSCFSKLCIYSDDKGIPETYLNLFNTSDPNIKPILEMVTFINLLRQDMGYGKAIIDTTRDGYRFIQTHRK